MESSSVCRMYPGSSDYDGPCCVCIAIYIKHPHSTKSGAMWLHQLALYALRPCHVHRVHHIRALRSFASMPCPSHARSTIFCVHAMSITYALYDHAMSTIDALYDRDMYVQVHHIRALRSTTSCDTFVHPPCINLRSKPTAHLLQSLCFQW
jgi:hypothetical protein